MSERQEAGEIAVGLAGLGRFGKLHAAALHGLPGVRLVALCDPVATEVAALGERYHVPGRYTDFNEMLARAALDAVVIVSPEPLHMEQTLAAIGRGLHVFVEKPLAMTADDAARVVAAANEAGVQLQTGLLLRFSLPHATIKAQVAAGQFGQIVSARAKRNVSRAWFPDYGDRAHPVHETSIHDIDLLLWLIGSRCEKVYAVQRHISGLRYPDACFALLQFANGAVGIVETSWFVPAGAPANVLTETWHGTIDDELELIGTERTAHLAGLAMGPYIWTPQLTAHPDTALWPELAGHVAGALREEDAHFIDRIRTGTPSAVATIEDAVAGLRIAEAIIASAESGREVSLVAPDSTFQSGLAGGSGISSS